MFALSQFTWEFVLFVLAELHAVAVALEVIAVSPASAVVEMLANPQGRVEVPTREESAAGADLLLQAADEFRILCAGEETALQSFQVKSFRWIPTKVWEQVNRNNRIIPEFALLFGPGAILLFHELHVAIHVHLEHTAIRNRNLIIYFHHT